MAPQLFVTPWRKTRALWCEDDPRNRGLRFLSFFRQRARVFNCPSGSVSNRVQTFRIDAWKGSNFSAHKAVSNMRVRVFLCLPQGRAACKGGELSQKRGKGTKVRVRAAKEGRLYQGYVDKEAPSKLPKGHIAKEAPSKRTKWYIAKEGSGNRPKGTSLRKRCRAARLAHVEPV